MESLYAVLDSGSVRLFGEKGPADTSPEETAADCGMTIRLIQLQAANIHRGVVIAGAACDIRRVAGN